MSAAGEAGSAAVEDGPDAGDGKGTAAAEAEAVEEVKIVVVGDGAVGKTCLCHVFVKREFPHGYEPTIFENYTETVDVGNKKVRLQLWDTAGQENFDKIRILCYENTKCFIVCFSVVDGVSFSNVKHTWVEEVRQHQPSAKILLVGTKSDLRGKNKGNDGCNGSSNRGEDVPTKKILKLVQKEGLDDYVETSALNGVQAVDKVFKKAIRVAIGSDTVSTGEADAVDGSRNDTSSPPLLRRWRWLCLQ